MHLSYFFDRLGLVVLACLLISRTDRLADGLCLETLPDVAFSRQNDVADLHVEYLFSLCLLQAMWRGHRVRRKVIDKKVVDARRKVKAASKNVKEENKLCHRTTSALDFLLSYKQLSYVLEALINLGEISFIFGSKC